MPSRSQQQADGTFTALSLSGNLTLGTNVSVSNATNGYSGMYFDVSTGGTANGAFIFRGTNSFTTYATLTNTSLSLPAGLSVAGTTALSSALTYGGVTLANSVTGTGSMALSVSPAFTGTASFVNTTNSGTLAVTGATTLSSTLGASGTISITGTGAGFAISPNRTDLSGRRNWGFFSEQINVGDAVLMESTSNTSAPATVRMRWDSGGAVTIPGNLAVTGAATFGSTTASTSTTSGALTVAGGLGVTGDIFANTLTATNGVTLPTNQSLRNQTNGYSGMYFDVSTGGATNGAFVWRGSNAYTTYATLDNTKLALTATTASTSSTSGALTVAGGLGVGGAANIGGTLAVTSDITWGGASYTSYSPATPTASSGTFTAVSATMNYKQLGKVVVYYGTLVITTLGTASGRAIIAVPVNELPGGIYPATAYNGGTLLPVGALVRFDAANTLSVNLTGAASGQTIYFSGTYQAA